MFNNKINKFGVYNDNFTKLADQILTALNSGIINEEEAKLVLSIAITKNMNNMIKDELKFVQPPKNNKFMFVDYLKSHLVYGPKQQIQTI